MLKHGIRKTFDTHVFLTERHAETSFSYEIPIYNSGEYVLILQFVEVYFIIFIFII